MAPLGVVTRKEGLSLLCEGNRAITSRVKRAGLRAMSMRACLGRTDPGVHTDDRVSVALVGFADEWETHCRAAIHCRS